MDSEEEEIRTHFRMLKTYEKGILVFIWEAYHLANPSFRCAAHSTMDPHMVKCDPSFDNTSANNYFVCLFVSFQTSLTDNGPAH